jgi:hypothetical protein
MCDPLDAFLPVGIRTTGQDANVTLWKGSVMIF